MVCKIFFAPNFQRGFRKPAKARCFAFQANANITLSRASMVVTYSSLSSRRDNFNVDDEIDFIFDGNQSSLTSDEEENDEIKDTVPSNVSDGKPTDAVKSDKQVSKQVLTIKAKEIMSHVNVHIADERQIRSFLIIRFLKNSLNHL